MFVRDAMCDRAEWIQPTVTIQQAARMMRDQAIGCLPVGENDRLIGIITDRDLAYRGCADGADPRTTEIRHIMSKGIVWCYDDEDIDTAIHRMDAKKIHHLPVLNRSKRLVGILTLSDLASHASGDLFSHVSKLTARDTGLQTPVEARLHGCPMVQSPESQRKPRMVGTARRCHVGVNTGTPS